MMNTLIIGYGNTLRGDDGLGVRAVEALAEENLPENIETLACPQLRPELAERLSRCERAVFIDAAAPLPAPANFPGLIRVMGMDEWTTASRGSGHSLDVSGLLELTGLLYGRKPEAWLCTVEAASFDLSEQLSPQVQAALTGLQTLLKRHCFSDS